MRRFISFASVVIFLLSTSVQPVMALEGAGQTPNTSLVGGVQLVDDSVGPIAEEKASVVSEPQAQILAVPASQPEISTTQPIGETQKSTIVATPQITAPINIQPKPFSVSASEPVIVSSFKIIPNVGFVSVELKNTSDSLASLSNMSIHLKYSTATTDFDCQVRLDGYVRPNSYIGYSTDTSNTGVYAIEGCPAPSAPLLDKEIHVVRGPETIELIKIAASDMTTVAKQWERKAFTASARTGVLATDFKNADRALFTSGVYEPPQDPGIKFLEIYPRPQLCSSGDSDPLCRPYIKIKNSGASAIDLSKFRLRSGSPLAQSSRYNTSSLSGIVKSGEFTTIVAAADGKSLALNDEDGATWLEDAYGVRTYANNNTPYMDAELALQKGRSWAFDSSDEVWKWANPSPYTEENNFIEPGRGSLSASTSSLKPCRDDQYRSEETNRCRSLSSQVTSLTPCKEGQYRSEETNRCRSIVLAARAGLKPCREDQYRSEETNRCRNVATASANLKPCKDNQYRSEETNRCRNVPAKVVPAAAYGVEPIKDTAKAFMGWWAIGGIALVAIGYAGWEWRREVAVAIQKITSFGSRRR